MYVYTLFSVMLLIEYSLCVLVSWIYTRPPSKYYTYILYTYHYIHYTHTYILYRSFYSSSRFADIPIPPSEDWEAATGQVYPSSFIHETTTGTGLATDGGARKNGQPILSQPRDLFTRVNLERFSCEWGDKRPTAFFRGKTICVYICDEYVRRLFILYWKIYILCTYLTYASTCPTCVCLCTCVYSILHIHTPHYTGTATGGGTTIDTNQRLHAAQLCYDWDQRPDLGGNLSELLKVYNKVENIPDKSIIRYVVYTCYIHVLLLCALICTWYIATCMYTYCT